MLPHIGRVLLLVLIASVANKSQAEIWNPFARKEPPPSDELQSTTPPAPLGNADPLPRPLPTTERPKWLAVPSLPWSQKAPGAPSPSVWERMQESTHRTWDKTRQVITAPFTPNESHRSDVSLWPRWRGFGKRNEVQQAGWFEEVEPAPSSQRISSVNEFLAQPRPQ